MDISVLRWTKIFKTIKHSDIGMKAKRRDNSLIGLHFIEKEDTNGQTYDNSIEFHD